MRESDNNVENGDIFFEIEEVTKEIDSRLSTYDVVRLPFKHSFYIFFIKS